MLNDISREKISRERRKSFMTTRSYGQTAWHVSQFICQIKG
ncbi:hypothetical protein LHGZ1_0392 [Laribacter hongkongensis]|uniref:Uncharacterized protein n=1 Tax=Laribacter hongkongensis TaxID=168471 RepID=A0A248LGB0_9NEIS|nr:hypothetical protein LHGZ1_0392 [Laribacter hongkongensis]